MCADFLRTAGGSALAGLKVVDFGTHLAGPLVGRILADLGADVVRVAPPGGAAARFGGAALDAALARGKTERALDLATPAGAAAAAALVADADVVVENWRPGAAAARKLDAASVRAANPRCVHLSLPGFAAGDAAFADYAGGAWEAVVLARCGVFSDMGLNRQLMGANPSYSPLPLASAYTSVIGALAVCMALLRREATGRGEALECPLAAGLADCLVYNSMDCPALAPRYHCVREVELARRRRFDLPLALTRVLAACM